MINVYIVINVIKEYFLFRNFMKMMEKFCEEPIVVPGNVIENAEKNFNILKNFIENCHEKN